MNVIYRQKGSWYDIETMKKTINTVLKPISRQIPEGKKGIILLDNCRAHWDVKDLTIKNLLQSINFEPVLLPSNTTGRL